MTFLLSYWRPVLVLILGTFVLILGTLWRNAVSDFAEYRGKVEALVKQQESEAKRIEAEHQKVLEEVSNAWNNQLPAVRDGAVRAYLARHPGGAAGIGLRPSASASGLSVNAASAEGSHATSEECLAAERPADDFIRDCAEDALTVILWQRWAKDNGLEAR